MTKKVLPADEVANVIQQEAAGRDKVGSLSRDEEDDDDNKSNFIIVITIASSSSQ